MKLIDKINVKEFEVKIYESEDYNQHDDYYSLYSLVVENRLLKIRYKHLRDYYIRKNHIPVIGVSLMSDTTSFKSVIINETEEGYSIDCLKLTKEEFKNFYILINKIIRNNERIKREQK